MSKIVMIESPYAGDVEGNLAHLDRVMRLLIGRDFIPVAPHLMWPRVMDDNNPEERERALVMCRVLRNQILRSGGLVAFAPRTDEPISPSKAWTNAFSTGMWRGWSEAAMDHGVYYHSIIDSILLVGVRS